MNSYIFIFTNSLISSLVFSIRAEVAWFAALDFGQYNMVLATAMALAGAVIGAGIDYGLGHALTLVRSHYLPLKEESFMRAAKIFRRYMLILLLFPWIPFTSFFAFATGFFRVPPWLAIGTIMLGRAGYYSYYLLQH